MLVASVHVDSPDVVDIHRFTSQLVFEHQTSIPDLSEPDSLDVSTNLDGSMIVSAHGRLPEDEQGNTHHAVLGFEFPPIGIDRRRTLTLLEADDLERTLGNISSGIAGNVLLHAASGPSGTDQGHDILLASQIVTPCLAGDFNCDQRVDGMDLGRLLGYWGLPQMDLDGDGNTDGADLAILLGNWTE
jgi:hypothetical protein